MIKIKCAICNIDDSMQLYPANFSAAQIDKRLFYARRPPDKIHYRMVRCNKCGLIYSNPILPAKQIEKFYRESGTIYHQHIDNLNKTYGFYLKKAEEFIPNKQKLLEIGCGNGFFLQWAKDHGWREVRGVEPGENSVRQAPKWLKENIIIDVFKPNQFKANFFDCVVVFQTLDHLVEPNKAIAEIRRILKKGGVVLVIVHDVSSWSAKLLGERSPIIDIEHIYLFDKKTLPMIFEKHGFEVVEVFDVVNTHALGYWIYLAPMPSLMKKVILKFVEVTGLARLPLSLRAGNIGFIGKK